MTSLNPDLAIAARPPQMVRRRVPAQPRYSLIVLFLFVAFCSAVYLVFADADHRAVFAPALTVVNLAVFYFAVLYKRDGRLPVLECGSLFVASTALYSVFPLLNFKLGGMRWGPPADYRLVGYDPSPQEMGAFAWNHVLYLGTFIFLYLLIRGRKSAPPYLEKVDPTLRSAVLVTFVVVSAILFLVRFVLLPPEAGVSVYEGGTMEYRQNVPLIVLQFINITANAAFILKILFAILVLAQWRDRKWRIILMLWVPFELLMTTRSLSRASFVVLIVAIGVLYHRLVRPLSVRAAVAIGTLLVSGFLTFGFLRDMRGRNQMDFATLALANNEFQALFANAFDIQKRKELRLLPEVPPQLAWSDLYMLVPSQFLPFYKWDTNEWYAEVLGIRNTGSRTMFGTIAQAMLGLGKIEVFVRALALAIVLGLLHRWYVRNGVRFWPTALYVYITIWVYYTYRSTTFHQLYMVVYYFGAAALLVAIVQFGVAGRRRLRR